MTVIEENRDMNESVSEIQTNIIHYADCLNILQDMPDESVDMIYLDPPFDMKANKMYGIMPKTLQEEDIFGGIFDKGDVGYINLWLAGRMREMKCVLKPTGSIFLHLNDKLVFEAKMMMDKIFGKGNFKNAVVWCYKTPSTAKNGFPEKHDTILFYAKDKKKFVFNPQRIPCSKETIKRKKYSIRSIGSGKIVNFDMDESKMVEDFWMDVAPMSQSGESHKNRYPTQKPQKLLERIIKCSTNESDIVMDPFAGSGTTGIVASKLNRKWIMVDAHMDAFKKMQERFINIPHIEKRSVISAVETNTLMAIISEDPTIAEKEVCKRLKFQHTGKTGDHGLDGIKEDVGLQVKRWGAEVGEATIREFIGSLLLVGLNKGIFVASGYSPKAKEVTVNYEGLGFKIELETFRHLGMSFENIGK